MTQNEIRVGIVGASAEKNWAKVSHVPTIKGLAGLRLAAVALVLLFAEPRVRGQVANAALALPDAPLANLSQTSAQADAPAASGQSSSQTSPAPSKAPPLTPEEQRKKAQEQLEQEEHQRVWAVVATFNTTANREAIPLSSGQKFQLFFKSAMDPWPFLLAAVLAGTNQAQDSFPEYGQGVQGYAKRFGASYGDYFIGNLMGNAVLASLLRRSALLPEGHRQLHPAYSLGSKRHRVVQAG